MNELTGQFPADWELLRLPEVLFFQEGPGITSDKFTKEGIPFINIRCFVNGRIDRSSCQFISQKLGNGEYKHFQLDVNDWVFSSSGTIGKIALIFDEDLPLLLNTSTIRFRTQDEKRLANNYIKFFLESFHFKIQHQLQTQGSAQVNVGPTHLQKMHIPLPPIKEQTQIATILSTIDRAIEQTEALIAKQQRIKTGLMQDLLTKGIDENGNIRSEETHEFKDSPLGRIPVEWEVKSLQECVEFWDGKRVPLKQSDRDLMQGEIPYYGASGIIDYIDKYIFDEDLILVGEDGENVVSRRLPLCFKITGKSWVNNHAHVLKPVFNANIDFLTERLEFFDYTLLISGSAQPKLNQRNLRNLSFSIPPLSEQKMIASLITNQNRSIKEYETEKEKLMRKKTGLMQDLLTGKVRVTDLLNQKTATN